MLRLIRRAQTFTRGLLNAGDLEEAAIYRAKHHDRLSPLPEEPAPPRTGEPSSSETAGRLGGFAKPGLPTSSSGPHLPSASLILGETSALQPRMPRSASEVGRVPLSYAYGAPSSGKEKASHTKAPRGSLGGAGEEGEGSVGGKSKGSRGPGGEDRLSASGIGVVASPKRSDPATVRYARLKDRVKSTGSSTLIGLAPPTSAAASSTSPATEMAPSVGSSSGLIKKSVKPAGGVSSNNTSVNIATAFRIEDERRAALASGGQQLPRPPTNGGSYDMEVDLYDPDESISMEVPQVEEADDALVKETHQLPPGATAPIGDENVRKRKKGGRRSTTDPTYKYRPGDSASSDSEAGEGIGDKRGKREVKSREEEEAGETSLTGGGVRKRPPKKKARKTGDEEDTDSQEDTGEGIAKNRARRSLGDGNREGRPASPFPSLIVVGLLTGGGRSYRGARIRHRFASCQGQGQETDQAEEPGCRGRRIPRLRRRGRSCRRRANEEASSSSQVGERSARYLQRVLPPDERLHQRRDLLHDPTVIFVYRLAAAASRSKSCSTRGHVRVV